MTQKIVLFDSDREARQRFLDYNTNESSFFPIDRDCLVPDSLLGFNVYLLREQTLSLWLNGSADSVGVPADAALDEAGQLVIDSSDIPRYAAYLSEVCKKNAANRIQMVALQERSKIVMREIFEHPLDIHHASAVQKLTDDMLKVVLSRDEILMELLIIKRIHHHVYVHSVNVAVMAAAVGREMGLKDESLQHLVIGAFVHDIGKRVLPKDILEKQGRLSHGEYRQYRQHVPEGVRLLESTWKLPAPAILAVAQHHELLGGGGYPLGVKGDQVGFFGRILGVVNSFDNLIAPRPNKYAMPPFDALNLLVGEKNHWDRRVLAAFVATLGNTR